MLVRTGVGFICAAALVMAGIPPAVATGDDDSQLKVRVCKKVKDGKDGKDGKDEQKKKEDALFPIKVWTDKDSGYAKLGDDYCKKFKLDFKRNKFFLKEDVDKKDWDVWFKVRGDDEKTVIAGTKLKVKFDDHEDRPKLKITVINKKEDRKR